MHVCIYIYIYNNNIHSTVHTHILCTQKLYFWMRLIEINRCPALILTALRINIHELPF